jgi:hypothetical protein
MLLSVISSYPLSIYTCKKASLYQNTPYLKNSMTAFYFSWNRSLSCVSRGLLTVIVILEAMINCISPHCNVMCRVLLHMPATWTLASELLPVK